MFKSLMKALTRRTLSRVKPQRATPRLEALEDRVVPTTTTAYPLSPSLFSLQNGIVWESYAPYKGMPAGQEPEDSNVLSLAAGKVGTATYLFDLTKAGALQEGNISRGEDGVDWDVYWQTLATGVTSFTVNPVGTAGNTVGIFVMSAQQPSWELTLLNSMTSIGSSSLQMYTGSSWVAQGTGTASFAGSTLGGVAHVWELTPAGVLLDSTGSAWTVRNTGVKAFAPDTDGTLYESLTNGTLVHQTASSVVTVPSESCVRDATPGAADYGSIKFIGGGNGYLISELDYLGYVAAREANGYGTPTLTDVSDAVFQCLPHVGAVYFPNDGDAVPNVRNAHFTLNFPGRAGQGSLVITSEQISQNGYVAQFSGTFTDPAWLNGAPVAVSGQLLNPTELSGGNVRASMSLTGKDLSLTGTVTGLGSSGNAFGNDQVSGMGTEGGKSIQYSGDDFGKVLDLTGDDFSLVYQTTIQGKQINQYWELKDISETVSTTSGGMAVGSFKATLIDGLLDQSFAVAGQVYRAYNMDSQGNYDALLCFDGKTTAQHPVKALDGGGNLVTVLAQGQSDSISFSGTVSGTGKPGTNSLQGTEKHSALAPASNGKAYSDYDLHGSDAHSLKINLPKTEFIVGDDYAITATLTDCFSRPCANETVTFALSGGSNVSLSSTTVTTDSSGLAVVKLTATSSGSVTLSASFGGASSMTAITVSLPVLKISSAPSTMEVGDSATFAVVLKDSSGNPAANRSVIIGNLGPNDVWKTTAQTDSDGLATVTLASGNTIGPGTLYASYGGVTVTANCTVVAAIPTSVAVNGLPGSMTVGSPATLSVVVTNKSGHPCGNCTVTIANNGPANVSLSATTVTTDSSGRAAITVKAIHSGNINGTNVTLTFVAKGASKSVNTSVLPTAVTLKYQFTDTWSVYNEETDEYEPQTHSWTETNTFTRAQIQQNAVDDWIQNREEYYRNQVNPHPDMGVQCSASLLSEQAN
jgi:Bacterial Ig-like domain (group 1)